MRDSYRNKVYLAERVLSGGRIVDNTEGQEILDVLSDAFQVGTVTLQYSPRLYAWGGIYHSWGKIIKVPSRATSEYTLLHEFAHHLDKTRHRSTPGHSGSYVEAHLEVIEAWFDAETADKLRRSYSRYKVPMTRLEDEERMEQAATRANRDAEKHGERRYAYSVKLDGGWMTDHRYTSRWVSEAKVWLTERGAAKYAEKWASAEVVRVWVEGKYDYRWSTSLTRTLYWVPIEEAE